MVPFGVVGGAIMLGNCQGRGFLPIRPSVLVVGAGGSCLEFLSLVYHFSCSSSL